MKKLAVFFPGIGYTMDRPLLYFSRRLAEAEGYEVLCLKFKHFPKNSRGSKSKMIKSARKAIKQTEKQLSDVDLFAYDEVLFVAKSIGTVAAGHYAAKHLPSVRLVLYTPVDATFEECPADAVAFIGDRDLWSDGDRVKRLAKKKGIPLHTYDGCNHSLETEDVLKNIDILKDVMGKTKVFLEQ